MIEVCLAPLALEKMEEIKHPQWFIPKGTHINERATAKHNPEYVDFARKRLTRFILDEARRITQRSDELLLLLPLSGGVDSTVLTYLAIEAIEEGLKEGEIKKGSLELVTCTWDDVSQTDLELAELVAGEVERPYVSHRTKDISKQLRGTQELIQGFSAEAGIPLQYHTQTVNRIITNLCMGVADGGAYCAIDPTNATEFVLGEVVLGSRKDMGPLGDLWKTHVYDLGDLLGIPRRVVDDGAIHSTFGKRKTDLYFEDPLDNPFTTDREFFAALDMAIHYLIDQSEDENVSRRKQLAAKLGHDQAFLDGIMRRYELNEYRWNPRRTGLNPYVPGTDPVSEELFSKSFALEV